LSRHPPLRPGTRFAMPEYYLIPKRLIKRWPSLRQAAWAVEGYFFKALIGSARLLSPERAGALLSWLFGLVGPHTAKAAKADANLRFVLPQQSARERRIMVKQIFRNLGLATAELLAANRILAERPGQPLEKIERDTERDYYLSAAESAEYGLIDKVIDKRPGAA